MTKAENYAIISFSTWCAETCADTYKTRTPKPKQKGTRPHHKGHERQHMDEKERKLIRDERSEEIIRITEQLAMQEGAHNVTVRKIIRQLGTTNRVFYNRFRNCDEVLQIVYENAVLKMRSCFQIEYTTRESFFEAATELAVQVLISTYDVKHNFSQYMFEHDSLTESNRLWWMREVTHILEHAKQLGYIEETLDSEALSHSIWCFCRGFNADAIGRKLSKEDAVKIFRLGFGCFMHGVQKTKT